MSPFAGADDQADVAHPQQQGDLQEGNGGGVIGNGAREHQRNQVGAEDTQQGSSGRADQLFQGDFADLDFKKDDRHAEREPGRGGKDGR